MGEIKLSLETYKSPTLAIDLFEKSPAFNLIEISSFMSNKIYSDKIYFIKLIGDVANIVNATLYINGFNTEANYSNGEFRISNDRRRYFIDTFGFVQLSVSIVFEDDSTKTLFSEFLNVMVKEDSLNQGIRRMADYIYNNQEKLLLDDRMKSLDNANLKESPNKTLESQLNIIKNIILLYKENYRYFKNNSKFKLISNNKIDDYEKLKTVNDDTIKYIIQNPNELQPSVNSIGIKVGKSYFTPRKTLINNNVPTMELYENQVVLSFLVTMVNDISNIQKNIKNKISLFGKIQTQENGYVISAYMIYGATAKKLQDFSKEILLCKQELIELLKNYSVIFPFDTIRLDGIPKPTHTLLTVKQYNQIYNAIKKWIDFGIYNMERENFLVPFLANNQLYEYYILLKFFNYIEKQKGYSLTQKDRYLYKPNAKNYQNTTYCNTFNFQLRDKKLTLYYQPVIYLKPNPQSNNINILRNNKISMNNDREVEGNYYLPDFILKLQENGKINYLIADAKYSNQTNVKSYYFPNLVYKYLFSLSSVNENEQILGLCAINGKGDENDKDLNSVYTEFIPKSQLPFADIMTIWEFSEDTNKNEEVHYTLFDELLDKYSI